VRHVAIETSDFGRHNSLGGNDIHMRSDLRSAGEPFDFDQGTTYPDHPTKALVGYVLAHRARCSSK
jgi:hypothetical protein